MSHRSAFLFVFLVFCGLALTGCDRAESRWSEGLYDLTEIPVSPDLEPTLAASIARLDEPDADRKSVRDYAAYQRLRHELRPRKTHAAAADEIYARWETEPDNALWLSLAYSQEFLIQRPAEFEKMATRPALSDTNTALGCLTLGLVSPRRSEAPYWYAKAEVLQNQLTDQSRMFLMLRLSLIESSHGRITNAIERLMAAAPEARQVGGRALESKFWYYITGRLMAVDKLDDALHAATLAAAQARMADDQSALLHARIRLAKILFQRGEYEPAMALLEQFADQGEEMDLIWAAQSSLGEAATLASEVGDYERALKYDRRTLRLGWQTNDVHNIPRSMASIAHSFRMTGRLDSTYVYLKRAQKFVDDSGYLQNQAKMTELMAGYYCQVGNYALAESLLMSASEINDITGTRTTRAYLLLEMVPSALEMGRPDLAYEWLGEVDKVKDSLPRRTFDGNFLADYEILSARLLAEQGETLLAAAALDRARVAVETVGGEGKQWLLEAQTGELALRRHDLRRAEEAFVACLGLALQGTDTRQLARSRFQLGQLYLDQGQFESARAMFGSLGKSEYFGHAYRTSLTSLLLMGMTQARQGQRAKALQSYNQGLARFNPDSPADIVLRFHLARGQSLSKLGQYQAAAKELQGVLTTVAATPQLVKFDDLPVFRTDIARSTREALVHNLLAENRFSPQQLATATLDQAYPGLAGRLAQTKVDGPALVFFLGDEASWAWWVSQDRITLRQLPGRRALQNLIRPVLVDLSQPGRPVDQERMQQLAATLLGTDGDLWPAATPLTLVLVGILRQVPWAALPLPGAEQMVLDRGPLREIDPGQRIPRPSETVAPRDLSLMAIGCNRPGGTDLPTLRQAEAEARQVHQSWRGNGAELATGAAANWASLLAGGVENSGVIHLATHAEVHQGAARRSTLRLAAQTESGAATSTPVTMVAVRNLSLQAELVYLSSCEAGLPAGGPNHEAGDFMGAFLGAGARTVIASTQWVDDDAARFMAERFYEHWQDGASKAAAFQAARQDVRATWNHPAYWAFFRLLGDGS